MAFALSIACGPLFSVARDAYVRAAAAEADSSEAFDAALTAIVFSAVSLEAFINEVAIYATFPSATDSSPELVTSYAALAAEIENNNGGVRLKFLLLSSVFSGKSYDQGAAPYQDFSLLVDLRNALVHHKPVDRIVMGTEVKAVSSPKDQDALAARPLIRKLRGKAISPSRELSGAPLIALLGTPLAARWACDTAIAMVQSVPELMTDSAPSFKAGITRSMLIAFEPLPKANH
jgi:hypothetical protein